MSGVIKHGQEVTKNMQLRDEDVLSCRSGGLYWNIIGCVHTSYPDCMHALLQELNAPLCVEKGCG